MIRATAGPDPTRTFADFALHRQVSERINCIKRADACLLATFETRSTTPAQLIYLAVVSTAVSDGQRLIAHEGTTTIVGELTNDTEPRFAAMSYRSFTSWVVRIG